MKKKIIVSVMIGMLSLSMFGCGSADEKVTLDEASKTYLEKFKSESVKVRTAEVDKAIAVAQLVSEYTNFLDGNSTEIAHEEDEIVEANTIGVALYGKESVAEISKEKVCPAAVNIFETFRSEIRTKHLVNGIVNVKGIFECKNCLKIMDKGYSTVEAISKELNIPLTIPKNHSDLIAEERGLWKEQPEYAKKYKDYKKENPDKPQMIYVCNRTIANVAVLTNLIENEKYLNLYDGLDKYSFLEMSNIFSADAESSETKTTGGPVAISNDAKIGTGTYVKQGISMWQNMDVDHMQDQSTIQIEDITGEAIMMLTMVGNDVLYVDVYNEKLETYAGFKKIILNGDYSYHASNSEQIGISMPASKLKEIIRGIIPGLYS